MEFTFNYLEYQYRVKELGRGAEVRIVHTEMELEYNEILGLEEASLLMKLLASSGKEVAAPAKVADSLRHAMRDFQRRLIETVRKKGYRFSVCPQEDVNDGGNATAVRAGVPASDGRTGACGARTVGAVGNIDSGARQSDTLAQPEWTTSRSPRRAPRIRMVPPRS